jgi:flagellar protein FlaF
MYQISYAESLEDNAANCRDRERRALDHAIILLLQAEAKGATSTEAAEALSFLCALWKTFIDDLASRENDLPDVIRADLLSIGVWVLRESESIRIGQSDNFRGLVEICATIRDGLN